MLNHNSAYGQRIDGGHDKVPGEVQPDGEPERAGLQVSQRQQDAHQDGVGGGKRRGGGIAQMAPPKQSGKDKNGGEGAPAFDQALKRIAAKQDFFARGRTEENHHVPPQPEQHAARVKRGEGQMHLPERHQRPYQHRHQSQAARQTPQQFPSPTVIEPQAESAEGATIQQAQQDPTCQQRRHGEHHSLDDEAHLLVVLYPIVTGDQSAHNHNGDSEEHKHRQEQQRAPDGTQA